MRILNLTQHVASAEQIENGVIEPSSDMKQLICELLTFNHIPSQEELENRAHDLSHIAAGYDINNTDDGIGELFPNAVMLGGAPFFMSTLERWCESVGVTVLYAFSERISIDSVQENGEVIKRSVFKHKGFVGIS